MIELRYPVVIDTNILFSALLREPSPFVSLIFQSEYEFYICEYVIIELFKHKERLLKHSKLSEEDLLRLLYRLLKRLNVYPERLIRPEFIDKAEIICAQIDPNDTIHVALALALDGRLWTGDKRLIDGLRQQGSDILFSPAASRR